jgi:hypothetical protein
VSGETSFSVISPLVVTQPTTSTLSFSTRQSGLAGWTGISPAFYCSAFSGGLQRHCHGRRCAVGGHLAAAGLSFAVAAAQYGGVAMFRAP